MKDDNLIDMVLEDKKKLSYNVMFIKLKSKMLLQKKNELSFFIKVYNHNGIPDYLNSLTIGESVWISNPMEKLEYNPNYKKILMICGGTGITPMLQILRKENFKSKFTIISCNSSLKDIILSKDIINDDLSVFHVISKKEENNQINNTKYFIDEKSKTYLKDINKIKKYDFVYVCGPPNFMNVVSGDKLPDKTQGEIVGLLKEMGYDSSNVYKF
ncbi:nadh-cytochrome b5 reductase-like protein [Vairimorpha apis BRL 01]|uniref:Nadh-cytochrome b5 reductase-like protein n=1 Tax=Vairimorpha apis BRL 01 TaxID=1037528 RepID=T0MBS7_9MICR|nr:nadh-cytochrome b5 reductase-like protein [Vairimorpha apis BRL 01]